MNKDILEIEEQNNPYITELHFEILNEANKMTVLKLNQVHEIFTYDPETETAITSYIQKINKNELLKEFKNEQSSIIRADCK